MENNIINSEASELSRHQGKLVPLRAGEAEGLDLRGADNRYATEKGRILIDTPGLEHDSTH